MTQLDDAQAGSESLPGNQPVLQPEPDASAAPADSQRDDQDLPAARRREQVTSAPAEPPMAVADQRTMSMLCWLFSLLSLVGVIGQIVIYTGSRDRGVFVRHHAANTLNMAITLGFAIPVALVLGLLSAIPFIGLLFGVILIVFLGAIVVYHLTITIMGAVKASRGLPWSPPLTLRILR